MNNINKSFRQYINLLKISSEEISDDSIGILYDSFKENIEAKGSFFILGNGGSMANSIHIAGDFQKTFGHTGAIFNAIGENICSLTAAANDLSYEESFSLLLNSHILHSNKNLIFIFLSGSGNSANIVKAANLVNSKKLVNCKTFSISAYGGGKVSELTDNPISINTRDMEIAEDIQLTIFHHIKQKLAQEFDVNDLERYQSRIVKGEVK